MTADCLPHNVYQITHANGLFSLPVRVYNHHIDSGRVVFVANYLKFMEQARTEWLRALGINLRDLERRLRISFVVRDLNAQYLKPAYLDELLTCTVRIHELNRSYAVLHQRIIRGDEILCEAKITTVCVSLTQFRPAKIPAEVMEKLDSDYQAQFPDTNLSEELTIAA